MVFGGDLVFSDQYQPSVIDDKSNSFWALPKVVNLESSIKLCEGRKQTEGIALSSSQDIQYFFGTLISSVFHWLIIMYLIMKLTSIVRLNF